MFLPSSRIIKQFAPILKLITQLHNIDLTESKFAMLYVCKTRKTHFLKHYRPPFGDIVGK